MALLLMLLPNSHRWHCLCCSLIQRTSGPGTQRTCKILSTNAELERERAAPITTASSTRRMLTNSAGEWNTIWSPANTAAFKRGGERSVRYVAPAPFATTSSNGARRQAR